MELTVLGRYGPYPQPGGACSGYLVTDGETRVLLDCGAGTFARLLEVVPLGCIDAIVLSHLHYDHCSDIAVMRYALEQLAAPERLPMPVYAPATPEDAHRLFEYPVFAPQTVEPGMESRIGSLTLNWFPMQHPVPTYGVLLTGGDGARLFYTGDTGYFDGLPDCCRGADTLLADACLIDADVGNKPPVHMTARQAGMLAKRANITQVLLTHLWGGACTETAVQKEVDMPGAVVVQELGHYIVLHKDKKEE